jgi:hypothetical protein
LLTCLPYGMLSGIPDVFSRWRRSGGRQDASSASGVEYTDVVEAIPELVGRTPVLLTTLDAANHYY